MQHGQVIAPARVRAGYAILPSGDVGRHGVAIMALRQGLQFDPLLDVTA